MSEKLIQATDSHEIIYKIPADRLSVFAVYSVGIRPRWQGITFGLVDNDTHCPFVGY